MEPLPKKVLYMLNQQEYAIILTALRHMLFCKNVIGPPEDIERLKEEARQAYHTIAAPLKSKT